jgi:hypothetical protein
MCSIAILHAAGSAYLDIRHAEVARVQPPPVLLVGRQHAPHISLLRLPSRALRAAVAPLPVYAIAGHCHACMRTHHISQPAVWQPATLYHAACMLVRIRSARNGMCLHAAWQRRTYGACGWGHGVHACIAGAPAAVPQEPAVLVVAHKAAYLQPCSPIPDDLTSIDRHVKLRTCTWTMCMEQ